MKNFTEKKTQGLITILFDHPYTKKYYRGGQNYRRQIDRDEPLWKKNQKNSIQFNLFIDSPNMKKV